MRLHLSVNEFWNLLPKEFYAIAEEYGRIEKEQADLTLALEKMADWRMGVLAAVIANSHRSKGRKFKPEDFMPQQPVKKGVKMTPDEMKEELKRITIAMGGEVKI